MQFIDLKTQFERIEAEVTTRVDAVLRSQMRSLFLLWPMV